MSSNDNGALLRRYIEQVDPHSDVDALPDYFDPEVSLPANTAPNGRQGLEGMREHVLFLRERVRYTSTVEDLLVDGDKVAARVTIRGRIVGEFMDLPVNGKEFTIEEFMIAHFRNGKIAEVWRIADLMTLTQQIKGER
jgi:predicted ester cyclase